MSERMRTLAVTGLGIVLGLFTVAEVNLSRLQPETGLATFGLLGIVICFLIYPVHPRLKNNALCRGLDLAFVAATIVCFGYVIVQSESVFEAWWSGGQKLGDRAGAETTADFWVGLVGLVIVLEATRRSIGWALPILALLFIAHAYYGEQLPDFLLPHAQMRFDRIVSVTFLQSLGVFGPAMKVMFKYVFLFVVFGSFLEVTGGTRFIVDFSERVFGRSPGGPAKVSVLGSGLMGSLSGSAVANAVTTGTFTIPMMRNAGFQSHVAAGITAAAASGGALVPPVMGAGAYMMLEIVEPQVTFLQVAKAALLPAMLYYFSIFMIVHFYAHRTGTAQAVRETDQEPSLLSLLLQFEGIVFFGALISLIAFLLAGFSPFRSVSLSLGVIVLLGLVHPRQRLTLGMTVGALRKAALNGVSLVSASACVGIIIGIVQTTGIASEFNFAVKGLVEQSLLLALFGIMLCSIVLGMGVPSVVCYLLMATLMGTLLKELGVIPLAAHLFIFYFGMMSMVTPPVALAAFASASIAEANIMRTALAAFTFALVGFTLPYMFIYRPELLLMSNRPEVTKLVVEESDGELVQVSGTLERIGQQMGDARLLLAASGPPIETATNAAGRFEVDLAPGAYNVSTINADDERLYLGALEIDPAVRTAEGDQAAVFLDRRVGVLNVLAALIAAGMGIIALAAGLAGYLRSPLGVPGRVFAFATAALLLYPGRGFLVGDVRIAVSDVIGLGLLLGLYAVNRPGRPL